MSDDPDEIDAKVERVEEIIARLEAGDPTLGEGQSLLEEGRRLVDELQAELEAGDGNVEERN